MKLNAGAAAGAGAVVLAAAVGILFARRSKLGGRGQRRDQLDLCYSDFMGRAIAAQTEKQVLGDLADTLRSGLKASDVILISSMEQEGTYHPMPDASGAIPAPPPESARSVWPWLKRNALPIPVAELGDKRFGAMRLPLGELARTYNAAILAPLVHRGELVGLAAVARPQGAPDADERIFLERLMPPASAAAANVRLHLDAAMTISLGQEVGLARSVQSAIIPPETELERPGGLKLAAHLKFVAEAGSEFWTYYDLPDGRLLVIIGDALGEGIGASMVTAIAKGALDALRALSPDSIDLPRMATALNKALYRGKGRSPHLLTLVLALVDPHNNEVSYVCAGHRFPYLATPAGGGAGGDVTALTVHGPPIGLEETPRYTAARSPFFEGQTLVLFTDGLFAARTRSAQRIERAFQKRLARDASVAPLTLRANLLATLAEARGGSSRDDEILLVIRG